MKPSKRPQPHPMEWKTYWAIFAQDCIGGQFSEPFALQTLYPTKRDAEVAVIEKCGTIPNGYRHLSEIVPVTLFVGKNS